MSDVIVTDGDRELADEYISWSVTNLREASLNECRDRLSQAFAAYRVQVAAEERARCVEFLEQLAQTAMGSAQRGLNLAVCQIHDGALDGRLDNEQA